VNIEQMLANFSVVIRETVNVSGLLRFPMSPVEATPLTYKESVVLDKIRRLILLVVGVELVDCMLVRVTVVFDCGAEPCLR